MHRSAALTVRPARRTTAPRNRLAPVALGLALAAGCADVVTYSKDSQRQGMKQFEAGAYGDAAGSFRDAVRQDPRSYQSHYYLGASYEKLGSYHQAVQSYQTSLQVMDRTLQGQEDKAFRAQTVDALGRVMAMTEARAADVPAVPEDPKHPGESAWVRAKMHRYGGDADGAIEAYGEASLRDPKNFHLAKDFGLYLEELGQVQRADTALRKAYALNPRDEQVVAAMRRIGVVPGPSLQHERDLAKPLVPKGPIPQVDLSRLRGGGGRGATGSEGAAPAGGAGAPPSSDPASPRD